MSIDNVRYLHKYMPQIKTQIISQRSVAKGTTEIAFAVPADFKFIAGQYITITLPELSHLPIKDQFRDFSISSSPSLKNQVNVTFRQSDSVFKQTLLKSSGKQLLLDGPSGIFTLPGKGKLSVVAVAGGIGITPFMSMLGDAKNHFKLVYYNRAPETATYLKELKELLGDDLYAFFGPPQAEQLQALYTRNKPDYWYIAGPPTMVAIIRQLLKTLMIDDTMIRTEEFTGYEAHE